MGGNSNFKLFFWATASSTTKTGCHDIAEILLKVALNTKDQSINQSIYYPDHYLHWLSPSTIVYLYVNRLACEV
jgi:hypothetical protein